MSVPLPTVLLLPAVFLMAAFPALGAVERQGDAWVVASDTCRVMLSATDGAILSVSAPGGSCIWRSGEYGLWQLRFRDGTLLNAADFGKSAERTVRFAADGENLRLDYAAPEAAVSITVSASAQGVELRGKVTPAAKTVLDFSLPARLRFPAAEVQRLVFPGNGNSSVGLAFNRLFFSEQPLEHPSSWRSRPGLGGAGYQALYGGPLDQRADAEPPVALRLTEAGAQWLPGMAGRINSATACVNRPSKRDQVDLTLVDSDNGPYFAASHLGGSGYLWRLGGRVGQEETGLAVELVGNVIQRLAQTPGGRTRIGLLNLENGPDRGGWANVTVTEWADRLRQVAGASRGAVSFTELHSTRELAEALSGDEFLCVLNPYGEALPILPGTDAAGTVQAIGAYVRRGGNWFEVGGYPFHYVLEPVRFFTYSLAYPDAFADFEHLESVAGNASVYRVQPQTAEPWAGAKDHSVIFVPGRLGCGGDENGGYADRSFATYVEAGNTWTTPAVRLTVGRPALQALRDYAAANAFTRTLRDKMSPETLGKFANSVMLFYAGAATDKTRYLGRLPVPTLLHFSDYLKGGFDKEYPDHLPPNPRFGTPQEMREFFDRAHQLGHLVMPYTNPTWWCDHPRGPTFEREGDAPLLRNLDGSLSYERYGTAGNDGWTICHWHPGVQAANRRTVRQFTDEYPVDVLFQDQCGARTWRYDMNPASPTPYAYTDGLLSMVAEDCRTKPLSTESGWDRVVNYESQLCGMSWETVPTEGGPSWRRLLKYSISPRVWEVFPVAQAIAHDKVAMIHHDLGQFVTNRQVLSWSLGLGYCMSYRMAAQTVESDGPREWLYWLDRIQKSVCARYLGQPVTEFVHDRGPNPTVEDDGVIRARYGDVQIAANLGPNPRTEGGLELPGFGFVASAPGMLAANVQSLGGRNFGPGGLSFVTQTHGADAEAWVYARADSEVTVKVPGWSPRAATVTVDGRPPQEAGVVDSCVSFRLPPPPNRTRTEVPAALTGLAPRQWPGDRPAIGVLNFPGMAPSWTSITPQMWLAALRASRLATEWGFPVREITNASDLAAALAAGPTAYLVLLNPYGETFPTFGANRWKETLDAVRQYVNNGGNWWETAGYSLYTACYAQDGTVQREPVGPQGMGYLKLPVGAGDVYQPAELLRVTEDGRRWLGDALAAKVEANASAVNRGLTRGQDDPGHIALVAGRDQDFIGGYRLDGWGWLWRIGGFNPNPDVAVPVTVAAIEHLCSNPPEPFRAGGAYFLWHATIKALP